MGLKRIIFLTLVLFLLVSSAVYAGEVSSIRLRQASVNLPALKVYFHVLDEADEPLQDFQFSAGKLIATLGTAQAEIANIQSFEASGEGIAYIFLVDISKSLSDEEFLQMQEAMTNWISVLRPGDKVAIVSFGGDVKIVQDFSADQTSLRKSISTLALTDEKTQLHRGLAKAIELGQRADGDLPARRVIITLSDGKEDFAGGMVKEEVMAKIQEYRVPIYALGFYQKPLNKEKQDALNNLGEFARRSGGEYYQMETKSMTEVYEQIRQRILKSYVAELNCPEANTDGKVYRLYMSMTVGAKILSDGFELRLLPLAQVSVKKTVAPWWLYALSGILFVLIAALIIYLIYKKKSLKANTALSVGGTVLPEEDFQAISVKSYTAPVASLAKLRFGMVGKNAEEQSFDVDFTGKLIIGRNKSDSDVVFHDPEISGKHCEITMENGELYISDLHSTNGTYINGVPIKGRYRLVKGDLIMVGRVEFRVTLLA